MSLVDEFRKNKQNGGRYDKLSFKHLCAIIAQGNFFDYVENIDYFHEFIKALSNKFCEVKGIIPPEISFEKLPQFSAYAETFFDFANPQIRPKIKINTSLDKLFDVMQHHDNKFFPYLVFESIVHENCHVSQINAMIDNNFENVNDQNKISALNTKMSFLIKQAILDGQISLDEELNPKLSAIFRLDLLEKAFVDFVNTYYTYGNSPHEIAARDFAQEECENLLTLPNLTEEQKHRLQCFIDYSRLNSKSLLYNPKFNNYDFMEDLKRSQLFTAQPEILRVREELIEIVDKIFESKGLLTVEEAERMDILISLDEQFEFLKTRVGIDFDEREYEIRCEKLEQKALKKQEMLEQKLNAQYVSLFPKSEKLKSFEPSDALLMQPDISLFTQAVDYYENQQKRK